jgi:hypothetical protein
VQVDDEGPIADGDESSLTYTFDGRFQIGLVEALSGLRIEADA